MCIYTTQCQWKTKAVSYTGLFRKNGNYELPINVYISDHLAIFQWFSEAFYPAFLVFEHIWLNTLLSKLRQPVFVDLQIFQKSLKMAILMVQRVPESNLCYQKCILAYVGVSLSSIKVIRSAPSCPDTLLPAQVIPQYHPTLKMPFWGPDRPHQTPLIGQQ